MKKTLIFLFLFSISAHAFEFAQDEWSTDDKGVHMFGSYALTHVLDSYFTTKQSLAITIGSGILWEVKDCAFPCKQFGYWGGDNFSYKDLVYDVAGLITQNIVKIENLDLRNDFPKIPASIILSILTLQFTPIEYRKRILKNVYTDLIPGGCFILVEKLIGESDKLNENFVSLYYNLKKENGYSQEQIERKKLSLEGVLVPVTAKWNIELLQETGFKQIDCFWRWMNFAGFIAVK